MTVKNYPVGKPFVFQTNIHVKGKFTTDQRKELEVQLARQLDDSITVRKVSKAFGWDNGPKFFYEVMTGPAAFDSLDADKSVSYMRSLLQSLGYYRDSMAYTTKVKKKDDQLRTTIDFYAEPRILTRLDSISYTMNNDSLKESTHKSDLDTLQRLTINARPSSLIKKGDAFATYSLSAERDRLADIYRNNGYLKFSEEEILILWDTVGIGLLRPTLDPVEQFQLLQERARRIANPVADIEYRLRENPDSSRTTRYYVGKVTVYPDYRSDTTTHFKFIDTIGQYVIKYNDRLFRKRIFPDYIFFTQGALYRQSNYLKTQYKFNSIPAWRLVNIAQNPRAGQDTADFDIRLTPASKYSFTNNLEVNYNQGSAAALIQGNLIGLGFTVGVQNRNFAKGANQTSTNFRFGTEINANTSDLIQTKQISFSHTIQFPRLTPKFPWVRKLPKETNINSILAFGGGITDRRDYFNLVTANASYGVQSNWKNKSLSVRLPNIEYNYLIKRDSLVKLIDSNRSYQYIFNTGVIVSGIITYNIAQNKKNLTNLLTLSGELSGLGGLVRSKIFSTNLYQFLKVDAEFRQTHTLFRNYFAWRVFAGAGLGTPHDQNDSNNRYLPFFRQYYVGGPNSMRAWSIRKLGPGSTLRSFGRSIAPDRFGDVRLEGNAEYRFYIANYNGITINSALFADVGNVWFIRSNPDFPDGEFPNTFAKLWKDIGIGVGTGLRLDFSIIKLRIDYAYKAKDPSPENIEAQNKWFYGLQLFNGQVQVGIDYPF